MLVAEFVPVVDPEKFLEILPGSSEVITFPVLAS